MKKLNAMILMVDSAHGVYIPQTFIEVTRGVDGWSDLTQEDIDVITDGPENELYWEVWEHVMNTTQYTADDGSVYALYQDGDLWAICDEMMTDNEKNNFYGDSH